MLIADHTDADYAAHKQSITYGIAKSRSDIFSKLNVAKLTNSNNNLYEIIDRKDKLISDLRLEIAFLKNAKSNDS